MKYKIEWVAPVVFRYSMEVDEDELDGYGAAEVAINLHDAADYMYQENKEELFQTICDNIHLRAILPIEE